MTPHGLLGPSGALGCSPPLDPPREPAPRLARFFRLGVAPPLLGGAVWGCFNVAAFPFLGFFFFCLEVTAVDALFDF